MSESLCSLAGTASGRVVRFDVVERALHWCTATVTAVLVVTGFVLYVPSLSSWVGRRALLRDLHVGAGLVLPWPFVAAYAGPWRVALRRDVHRLARWSGDDVDWLRSLGRRARDRTGKFNAGQKANAVFVAAALPVMAATGSIMRWFEPFPLSWRTGATFVHDSLALLLAAVLAGHVAKALSDPVALSAMVRGWVPRSVVDRHHPRWAAELEVEGEHRGRGRVRRDAD